MKIAIDVRTAAGQKAGKGWYTFHIVKKMLELDHENEYLLYTRDKIAAFDNYKNSTQKVVDGGGFLWHYKTAKDLKKQQVDIFFSPTSYITPVLVPKGIKVVLTVHDLVAFLFPNQHNKKAVYIEKMFLKKALKRADFICTVSQNTKRDIIHKFNCDDKKIDTVYCSADSGFVPHKKQELTDFAKKTNLPKDFFLAVGTLEPRKNFKTLIEAFALVQKKHPQTHLIIVGKEGWDYRGIYDAVKFNYLNKKVHFLGYLSVESLANLYNLARAFVFPSFYEGFGIPPLEALKCGCPVIASYTSSIPEVVGDAGILVNPESKENIAAAMIKVYEDSELREQLRNEGFIQSKKFSWEASARKMINILNRI